MWVPLKHIYFGKTFAIQKTQLVTLTYLLAGISKTTFTIFETRELSMHSDILLLWPLSFTYHCSAGVIVNYNSIKEWLMLSLQTFFILLIFEQAGGCSNSLYFYNVIFNFILASAKSIYCCKVQIFETPWQNLSTMCPLGGYKHLDPKGLWQRFTVGLLPTSTFNPFWSRLQ